MNGDDDKCQAQAELNMTSITLESHDPSKEDGSGRPQQCLVRFHWPFLSATGDSLLDEEAAPSPAEYASRRDGRSWKRAG